MLVPSAANLRMWNTYGDVKEMAYKRYVMMAYGNFWIGWSATILMLE
jgi:hypothetical protein